MVPDTPSVRHHFFILIIRSMELVGIPGLLAMGLRYQLLQGYLFRRYA